MCKCKRVLRSLAALWEAQRLFDIVVLDAVSSCSCTCSHHSSAPLNSLKKPDLVRSSHVGCLWQLLRHCFTWSRKRESYSTPAVNYNYGTIFVRLLAPSRVHIRGKHACFSVAHWFHINLSKLYPLPPPHPTQPNPPSIFFMLLKIRLEINLPNEDWKCLCAIHQSAALCLSHIIWTGLKQAFLHPRKEQRALNWALTNRDV